MAAVSIGARLKCVTINTDTNHPKTKGTRTVSNKADTRYELVEDIIKNNEFIALQEITIASKLKNMDGFAYYSNEKEAGVLVNTDVFEDIKRVSSDMRMLDRHNKSDIHRGADLEAGRFILVSAFYRPTGLRCLLCSYHGKKKINKDKKISMCQILIRVCEEIKRNTNIDVIIIGGDFNIHKPKIKSVVLEEGYYVTDNGPSPRRGPRSDVIDYFISNSTIHECKYPPFTSHALTHDELQSLLNHDPLEASINMDYDSSRKGRRESTIVSLQQTFGPTHNEFLTNTMQNNVLLDDKVWQILQAGGVNSKSDTVNQLLEDVDLSVLRNDRETLFKWCTKVYCQQLKEKAAKTKGLLLKKRIGSKAYEKICQDLVELYLYCNEERDKFPKMTVSKSSKKRLRDPNPGEESAEHLVQCKNEPAIETLGEVNTETHPPEAERQEQEEIAVETAEYIAKLDNSVRPYLENVKADSKEHIVKELIKNVEQDILEKDRKMLFDFSIERYSEQLKEQAEKELILKRRIGSRANERICQDLVDLYLYRNGETYIFPRDTISKSRKLRQYLCL